MKSICCFLLILFALPLLAQDQPTPGSVSGVGGIRLLAADIDKTREFYGKRLGLPQCRSRSDAPLCFEVNPVQKIEIDSLGRETGPNRLVFIAFRTGNAEALRDLLSRSGVAVGDMIAPGDDTKFFEIVDPERHAVRFVEFPKSLPLRNKREVQVSCAMIHVGYVVQNRFQMDHLYGDLLGFRVYWHGGRKDDQTDWVDMQVPGKHGTDWLEYMLNIPANADHHTLGVMNHIALGVPDIHAAEAQLRKNGWSGTEQPKIGRGGKWQLNLYDPDDTRVELMEFTPTQKPCCSEYTGPHPGPKP